MWMIAPVIAICRAGSGRIRISDCAQFLVEQGIGSISPSPDTVLKNTLAILEKEQTLQ